MTTRRIAGSLVFAVALAGVVASADTVTFEQIPGAMSANDLTPDGRYIVGETGSFFPTGTYIYDTTTNTLTMLPGPGKTAVAVSDDGTVILGSMPDPGDPDPEPADVAGMWTAATGWVSLGYLPNALECPSRSNGYELSADGSVAVGLSWDGCSGRGFVWTAQTGMLELEPLANGSNRASVVSADGTLVGGFAQGTYSRTPAFWDGVTLEGELLDPPNGDAQGEVYGMSDDGLVMLGTWASGSDPYLRAVKWEAGPGGWNRSVLGSGSLLPGWTGTPMDIADNGMIVGFDFLIGNRVAWIMLPGASAMTNLATYIADNGGTPPSFQLQVCQAISADGRLICGHSWPDGGAWIVRITPDLMPGDMDCDGDVDFDDIDPFVKALEGQAAYEAMYPDCEWLNGDVDGDGTVDFDDIDPFVGLLTP